MKVRPNYKLSKYKDQRQLSMLFVHKDYCTKLAYKLNLTSFMHQKIVESANLTRLRLSVLFPHRPTKFSSTLLLPALWLPTTAIWGKSNANGTPREANASCSRFTMGISCSIPEFPAISDTLFPTWLISQLLHAHRQQHLSTINK